MNRSTNVPGPGTVRIAGVQMDIALGDVAANLAAILERLAVAASQGSRLVVFPECALTGYCCDSREEARTLAETIPGPRTEKIQQLCRQLDVCVVVGTLEAAASGIYNACVLIGPQGVVGRYRKVHLPYLGVDRFVAAGDEPFAVHDLGGLRVGMNICYDASFPEACRTLALQRADLIVLPTNWPPGSENAAKYMINTRAMENHLYFAAVNRVGVERGFEFIGLSKICDVSGETLAAADRVPTILYADIEPAQARNKRIIRVPKKHEIDRFADRRPEFYGLLTAEKKRLDSA